MIKVVQEAAVYLKKHQGKALVLMDLTGTKGSPEFMDEAKRLGKEVFNYKTEKAAILGITG